MKILKINITKPEIKTIEKAVMFLKNDNAIIHPTETVYGIAGIFSSDNVLKKINKIKGRDIQKPLSILVRNVKEILKLTGQNSKWLENVLDLTFPDAVTVLIPRLQDLDISYWNQFQYLGFRLPNHKISNLLVKLTGFPLVTTSANLSGQAAPKSLNEIPVSIMNEVSLVMDGGPTQFKIPSTIVRIDPMDKKISLVRKGVVPLKKIKKCLDMI